MAYNRLVSSHRSALSLFPLRVPMSQDTCPPPRLPSQTSLSCPGFQQKEAEETTTQGRVTSSGLRSTLRTLLYRIQQTLESGLLCSGTVSLANHAVALAFFCSLYTGLYCVTAAAGYYGRAPAITSAHGPESYRYVSTSGISLFACVYTCLGHKVGHFTLSKDRPRSARRSD